MIRINLLTEARAAAAKKKGPALPTGAKLNNLILIGGVLLGVLYIATMGLVLTSKRRRLDEEIGKAREEVARLKSIIDEVKSYEDKKKSLEEKIALINNLKTNQRGPVRLMDEVSKALPDLVWLTNMGLNGNVLTLQGQALNENAVANFIANLTASPFFAEPSLRIMSQNEQGIFSFDLACTFTHTPRGAAPAPGKRS